MQVFSILDAADQQFGAILNDRRTTIRLRYNPTSDRWSIDLAIDDLPTIVGTRITIGADILKAYNLDLGHLVALPVVVNSEPNRTSLPNGSVALYHFDDDEWQSFIKGE